MKARYALGTGVPWNVDEQRALPLLLMAAVWMAIVGIFGETAGAMVDIWTRSATFGHGYLIPLISLGLIWSRRAVLMRIAPRPSLIGLAGLASCSLLWIFARTSGIAVVEQLAFVLALQASVVAVLGLRVAAAVAFPLFYLVFMVPAGEFLVPPMQEFTAEFVVRGLRLMDIPVYVDGLFIYLPNGSFEVAEACAGLRYLIAMVALGALFTNLFFREWWRRLLFMMVVLVVPVLMNGLRALGIVLLAYFSDNRIAVGVDHLLYGWVFLSMTTLAVLAFGVWMRERPTTEPDATDQGSGSRSDRPAASWPILITTGVAAVLLAAAGPAVAYRHNAEPPGATVPAIELPPEIDGWVRGTAEDRSWSPRFPGTDQQALVTYRRQDESIDLYVAYYTRQRQGAEVVNALNRLASDETWTRVGLHRFRTHPDGGFGGLEGTRLISNSGDRRLAITLYWVAGRLTASPIEAKLLQSWALLTGTPEAAALVISAPYPERPEDAAETLRTFSSRLDAVRHALTAPSGP